MELGLLFDIAVIFALSTFVNYIFTKIRIPTIIGYLLTGVVAGPFALRLIKEQHSIELMAEIGVVLLMFTIGLEFSIKHLMKIRKVVFMGGFLQLLLTAGITLLLTWHYLVDWRAALFVGFLTALSSTAVVLKLLQERSDISSNYGRTVVGILIFQDVILIPLMLFTPMLAGQSGNPSQELLLLLGKTVVLVSLVYVGNRWLIPRILKMIAFTKNQELFMMTTFVICLSVALLTHSMGISLAFGAFLAGLMISDSEYSHNVFSNLIPFKDIFTSFFFVSIGMLLNINYVIDNPFLVFGTVVAVLTLKALVAGGTAFLLGHTFKGTVMVALSLCQVGEFSFILAQSGMKFNIISAENYQLFLSVAIISMSLTPLLMLGSSRLANILLKKLSLPKVVVNGIFPLPEAEVPNYQNHAVFIGKDSRSKSLALMAKHVEMPYISIIFDPAKAQAQQKDGDVAIYGDAINEPVLMKAHVDTAAIVVISIGRRIEAMSIIEKIRHINHHAEIIVRTKYVFDIEELYNIGANQVIPEEFETAVSMFERVLSKKLVPQRDINKIIRKIKGDNYGLIREGYKENKSLQLLSELPNLNIVSFKVYENSALITRSLKELHLRRNYGITLIAVLRHEELIEHPTADFSLETDDIAYIMGRSEEIADIAELFGNAEEEQA
ncbi:MAG: cation:proton antiporter [Bacteroidales bacterium]